MSGPYQDILKDSSESFEDGNYFLVTILDLDVNTTYPLEFRWKYKDGSFGKDWSAVRYILTPTESAPNTPNFSASNVDVSQPEKIIITWDGNSDDASPLTGIDRVDIYIDGVPFDGTKPTDSFVTAGTKIIPAPAGTYIISLYAVSKLGNISPVSTAVTKTVIAATPPVDPPTLPNGLSVTSAPFAVSVNWSGTYSSSDFDGFKSIDIHVRSSNLGSSATSGFSNDTLVANLTVDAVANRQNIGLDNLRQALSLASNQAAYTSPMFFYYIARNLNDELYSVSGTPTYTRINSSTVNPTQANFVDLANGVISIENLVAGNGQFSSWLRTGTAGGARIELSAVNDFLNSGQTVQKGLVAYSTGNTEIFNLDIDAGSLVINGSGTFTGDLTAGSGSSIFKSDASGIYLGNSVFASAPFSVSRNGVIKANSGTIGGWTLLSNALVNTSSPVSFRIQSVTDISDPKNKQGIIIGRTDQEYLEITSEGIVHRLANGNASGKFTLTTGSSGSLTMSGALTVNGGNAATTTALSSVETTANNAATAASNATTTANNASTTATNAATAASNAATAAATAQAEAESRLKASTNVIANSSKEITTINAGGVTIYSGASSTTGARVIMNSAGIAGYNSSGDPTFSVSASTGAAIFKGDITGASGTFSGTISSAANITAGGILSGSDIDIATDSSSARFKTSYNRSGPIDTTSISSTALNAVAFVSTTTSGWVTSCYPFYSGGSDLGVSSYRWRRLLLSNGDYGTAADSYLDLGSNTSRLYADGRIFANTLGVSTGTTIVQASNGFLRVSSSSQRYKENIESIDKTGYLNIINQLRPVTFNYKQEFSPDDYMVVTSGLIAEEVDQIEDLKTIVNYNDQGTPESISYDRLSAFLVLAIQEIKNKLENIETRLDALEG